MTTQRDSFFGEVVKAAYDNPNLVILSADSGAPVFDKFRVDRPQQWVHMGISEANMINVAAGLAIAGKQVWCYAIIPFITGRCLEQTKVAIALRGLPVTIVGVGAGYSYDDGGPTHYGVEDIGIMKNLRGIEIWSPASSPDAAKFAQMTINNPKFRYIRLDRHELKEPKSRVSSGPAENLILTYGSMLNTAYDIKMGEVREVPQVWPVQLGDVSKYKRIITIEEHFITGGLGTAVAEQILDNGLKQPLLRCALPDIYEWENGGRAYLCKRGGLDADSLVSRIQKWMK